VAEKDEVSYGPENPGVDWFLSGTIDIDKLENYTLSLIHPDGQHHARMWRSVFGISSGDGLLLANLLMGQLAQAERVKKRASKVHSEDPSRVSRRFTLDIPRFRGLNGNVGRVRTNWALDPGNDRPHLSTAFPKPTRAEERRYRQERREYA
jgi:hypothetical protein